jgi:hypothetical protein
MASERSGMVNEFMMDTTLALSSTGFASYVGVSRLELV